MSLFEKCYHDDIVYGTTDFQVPFPPPYMREVWDYKNASIERIQRHVSSVAWDYQQKGWHTIWVFEELHNKVIQCDYRKPPWMTDSVNNKLKERAKLTKKYF